MAFSKTDNLDTYKNNLEILGDKTPNLKTYIDELQAGAANYDVVSGTSQQATVNASYIPNNASLVTITLPVTAAVGQRLSVVGNGAGGWRIAQNAGQTINKSGAATTTGTVANTTWVFSSGREPTSSPNVWPPCISPAPVIAGPMGRTA